MTDTAVQTHNPVSMQDSAIQVSPAEIDQANWFQRINSSRFDKWVKEGILDACVVKGSTI